MIEFKKPEYNPDYNPVDYYNEFKVEHGLSFFESSIKNVILSSKNGKYTDTDATYIFKNGFLKANKPNQRKIEPNIKYSPFMLLAKYKFKGNYYAAYTWVAAEFLNKQIPYIRVGVDYFKQITKPDRYEIDRIELKRWKKDEIKDDHGKDILNHIVKYDDFIMKPDNKSYQAVVNNMYNMYCEFSHKPKKGKWIWTKRILEHVFGKQYEQGLTYLQLLYLFPKQILPILVLVSKTRSTGKSTFLDWMSILFGGNMVVINPSDITNQFNSSYAHANIVGIEETVTDKRSTVEKLKALSTNKFINLNRKFVDNSKIPFFAKFIVTTNDETKFMRIDDEEIRFWVRKLEKPKFHNTKIDLELIKEIPAFLEYLETLPTPDFSKSRMVFTKEEILTDELIKVKEESKPELYKDLKEKIIYFFSKHSDVSEFHAHPLDIKKRWYDRNGNIGNYYIRTILKDHFNMNAEKKPIYYFPFGFGEGLTHRPFKFLRSDFVDTSVSKKTIEIDNEIIEVNKDLPF